MPPGCVSILGLKVEAVQGKQVSIEWTETSGGLWEWWHDPGIPLAFPCVVMKEFPAFPSHLKRRPSPQERLEKLQGRSTIPRVPQMSLSIPGKPVFPALPRL